KISKAFEITKNKSKRIRNIEMVQKDEKTVRVIVSLKKDIDYDIVNVFGRNKSVIEIGDRSSDIYRQLAWEAKNLEKKAPALKPVKLVPRFKGTLAGKTIILDPGHGGDDPGALSPSGIPEKTLTLQTARAAAKLFRRAGATVYLTRDEDRRSSLSDVVGFANKSGADLLISIHYNSTHSARISGTETYYYNPKSREFAEKMHEAIIRGIKRKDRGLHRTPFYVIKNVSLPSVLLEPVYLTCPDENELAKTASFQEEVAHDILSGVKEYFRNKFR
ncbi:N-acetylmuramoyl-L-alanine amidase, partial [Candidatus Saganbacteria bacterium]|nr:N-acetylmuramoyl-L-alanine amidase [Candidatus Saganbacteria bacterium]